MKARKVLFVSFSLDKVRKDFKFKHLENVIVDNFYDIHTKDAKEILSDS